MNEDNLKSQLESLLLVSAKPLSLRKIAETLKVKTKVAEEVTDQLILEYNQNGGGIRLLKNNGQIQLASSPENTDLVRQYLKEDLIGELSEPSLETLTIIAYRQPVTKAEMEQIRGINCSLILRNLMIRGLVEAEYDKERAVTVYAVTMDFLKFLGVSSVAELPDFEKLNSDENLQKLLSQEFSQAEAKEDKVVKVEVKVED
ncbi:MAG: SMC-Scp complex subunit ScpB [Candidatus Komeilibacteria bacterium RIFCSPLOWO2_01_FULL_45_10]|uniref:SMC-Scp complex subunit ScpB n=1 Tax=Candidatus Komeilibacteria bacterium RIFCSPLOWO2_01_FULL_45_10 TaxID=1798550 RepID=A0A1G2BLE9_9BACT|nr:MAG: SMC-Scp complex subunit ScpB [Candidatus Komeilibacteria bacterium RIFCSPLOWO2_01_FULL_45_10]